MYSGGPSSDNWRRRDDPPSVSDSQGEWCTQRPRGRGGRGRKRFHSRGGYDGGGRGMGGGTDDGGVRESCPPELKGREIGLWHAKRSRAKKESQEKQQRPHVNMDYEQKRNIRDLLDTIRTSDQYSDSASSRLKPDMFDCPPTSGSSRLGQQASADVADEEADDDFMPDEIWESAFIEGINSVEENPWCDDREPETEAAGEIDSWSKDMLADYNRNQADPAYKELLAFRKKLPSYEKKQEILETVKNNQVLVISGETGCGKTTQVPQFILDSYIEEGMGSKCRILCTQPRRISAISVAERVAAERVDSCGGINSSIGYQIRLESKKPRSRGSILYCTTGIVLKYLESDPLLRRITHIVLDEIHERDVQSDFLMIILKGLLPKRPDLKVILMSATLNAEMFSKYFFDCPTLNIPGYTFPVKEYLLEDVIELLNYQPQNTQQKQMKYPRKKCRETDEAKWNFGAWCRNLSGTYSQSTIKTLQDMDFKSKMDTDLIVELIRYISHKKPDGAILVFVPGWAEISKIHQSMQKDRYFSSGNFLIIPLHSLMPTVNQRAVFNRPPKGVRKVIIATNIAETSITIDDIVYVIDGGKIKVKDFEPEKNLTTLEPRCVSRANAKQRRGRAGRVQAGECYHLYTGLQWMEMDNYILPEILRTRLEELCLNIKLLKLGKIEPFIAKAMQQPSMEALHRAISTLHNLNALDKDENLLPLGYHLARMPVEPHTGKMILFGAMFCCLDPILTVAASLSFKDAFILPLGREKEVDEIKKELSENSKSDHIMLIKAFKGWEKAKHSGNDQQYCWNNFLSSNTLKLLKEMKGQLAQLLHELGFVGYKNHKSIAANRHSDNLGLVKAVICAGLYPNVVKITKCPKPGSAPDITVRLQTHLDGPASVHPKSVNSRENYFDSKWMVYFHKLKTAKVYIHDCTMISPYPLLFFGGKVDIGREDEQDIIAIDDWIIFQAAPSIAHLFKDLRKELDKLLEHKITHPGPTDWDASTKEGALMEAILDLITTNEHEMQTRPMTGYAISSYQQRKGRDVQSRW